MMVVVVERWCKVQHDDANYGTNVREGAVVLSAGIYA